MPLSTNPHQRVGTRERLLDVAARYPDRLRIELHGWRHAWCLTAIVRSAWSISRVNEFTVRIPALPAGEANNALLTLDAR